jgi:hypothetical protein
MHLIKSYMVCKFWKLHNSFQKGCTKKNFFDHFVDCLHSLDLEFVAPSVQGHIWKKWSCKKTCQIVYRNLYYEFIFFAFLTFTKILKHNYMPMWKINTPIWIIIIWIIQIFTLKLIPCRFYIWSNKIINGIHR